jgi:hypothetical protein
VLVLHLNERQRQLLELHSLRRLDQRATTALDILPQSVFDHRFGKNRQQRHLLGLIHKLRKHCECDGVDPGRHLSAEVIKELPAARGGRSGGADLRLHCFEHAFQRRDGGGDPRP